MPKPASEQPDTEVTPDPKQEKRTRRRFSTEYKLRIIAEADQCLRGELGQLLRRESLYSSQIKQWREELANGGSDALAKSVPGPAASRTPDQRRVQQLEKENARLTQRLGVAEDCIDLQKKALSMLDHVSSGNSA